QTCSDIRHVGRIVTDMRTLDCAVCDGPIVAVPERPATRCRVATYRDRSHRGRPSVRNAPVCPQCVTDTRTRLAWECVSPDGRTVAHLPTTDAVDVDTCQACGLLVAVPRDARRGAHVCSERCRVSRYRVKTPPTTAT